MQQLCTCLLVTCSQKANCTRLRLAAAVMWSHAATPWAWTHHALTIMHAAWATGSSIQSFAQQALAIVLTPIWALASGASRSCTPLRRVVTCVGGGTARGNVPAASRGCARGPVYAPPLLLPSVAFRACDVAAVDSTVRRMPGIDLEDDLHRALEDIQKHDDPGVVAVALAGAVMLLSTSAEPLAPRKLLKTLPDIVRHVASGDMNVRVSSTQPAA